MLKKNTQTKVSRVIEINKKQAEYYDSISRREDEELFTGYGRNKSANFITKLWARLRYAHQDAFEDIGVDTIKETFLIEHCKEKSGGRFLEIGCFRGTRYSDPIIELAGAYTGIDLSANAIASFRNTVEKDGRANKVELIAGDLLLHTAEEKYDVLFAHGVLHHFESSEILFEHLNSLIKPGGILLCAEPCQVNKLFKFVRALYRPFQSDKDWEWPFTDETIKQMEEYFLIEAGFGWGRFSLPLSLAHAIPFVGGILRPLYIRLLQVELDKELSSRVWLNSTVVLCCRSKREDLNPI